ncbi:MAG: class B sortase [Bacilli bacterium]|nr:class B sortase [Bacilli bacterium]
MSKGRLRDTLQYTPYILPILLAGGVVIYSLHGEIKDTINYNKVQKELENINEEESFEYPVFEELPEEVKVTPKEELPAYPTEEEEIPEAMEEFAEEVEEPKYPISDELLTSGYEFKKINFDELTERNSDVNAWIEVAGTKIDYPIMYAPEKDNIETGEYYYLHHDIDNENSHSGTPFIFGMSNPVDDNLENMSDVSIIYGHHMKGGKVFANVTNYMSQSYYDEHPFGVIYTKDGYAYKITFFAGIITPGKNNKDVYVSEFVTEDLFDSYIENAREKSTFESDVEVNYGDKIMVLFTCEYTRGADSRYALFGVIDKQYTNELQISNNDEIHRSR